MPTMKMQELRQLARRAFGSSLEHATPENVREFLDGLQQAQWQAMQRERARTHGDATVLNLSAYDKDDFSRSWESQMRSFFDSALDGLPDETAATLWLFALELAYSGIEEMHQDALAQLFREDNP